MKICQSFSFLLSADHSALPNVSYLKKISFLCFELVLSVCFSALGDPCFLYRYLDVSDFPGNALRLGIMQVGLPIFQSTCPVRGTTISEEKR